MAVAYASGTFPAGASSASSKVITKPSGVVSGDLLVAFVSIHNAAAAPTVSSAPSGWTQADTFLTTIASGYDMRGYVYWKEAGGSEPADYTWTLSASTDWLNGCVVRLTGAHTTTPVDVVSSRGFAGDSSNADEQSTTTGVPAVTTTEAATLGIGWIQAYDTLPGNNTLTGWTNRADFDASFAGLWTRDFATATTYGAETTGETETSAYCAFTVAIRAPAAAAGQPMSKRWGGVGFAGVGTKGRW